VTEAHPYFSGGKHRPQTAKKLSILRKYFAVWLRIWAGPKCADWVDPEWHVIDLLAGTGQACGARGELLSGSPLVLLEEIASHAEQFKTRGITIHLHLVEQDRDRFAALETKVGEFLGANPAVQHVVLAHLVNDDANSAVDALMLSPTSQTPAFIFVDPFGAEINRTTVESLIDLPWKLDVLFNYMVESLRRTYGVAVGSSSRASSAMDTLKDFFGSDIDLSTRGVIDDASTYARAVFASQGLKTAAFRMSKPGTVGTQYILLFASRNDTVVKIVCEVYAKEMTDHFGQMSLLSAGEYLQGIEVIS